MKVNCYTTCAPRGINPRLMICHLRSKGFVLLRHLCSKGYVSLHHLCSKPSAVRPRLYFKLISVPHISWHDNLVHGSHCNRLGLLLGRPQTSLANLTMCMWIKDCAAQLLTGLNHEIKSHEMSRNIRKKYCHHAKHCSRSQWHGIKTALRKNHQKHFAIWSNINVTVATALLPALMGQEHSNK